MLACSDDERRTASKRSKLKGEQKNSRYAFVWGLGFMVYGLGFRVSGLRTRDMPFVTRAPRASEFRVQGLDCDLGCRV
jgi:hypothetical protein